MCQVDVVDFNGSFLGRVRDLVGPNPIVLVVTKVGPTPHFPIYLPKTTGAEVSAEECKKTPKTRGLVKP